MSYPAPPWSLQGFAYFSLHAIEIEKARAFIPPDLEIVPIFPNYTAGGVYISSYRSGSVLEYNELIIAPALVRHRNHVGGWISHIYVDHEDSVRGGREIWGLPKEMAKFQWRDGEINISQQEHTLCNFSVRDLPLPIGPWWRPPLEGYCLSDVNGDRTKFNAKFSADITLISSHLEIPPESPFFKLKLDRCLATVRLTDLALTVFSPWKIA
jgi:hypothetical protein